MNKIPTAEEYCRKNQNSNHPDMISKLMRDFAQLHVEAALKAAAEQRLGKVEDYEEYEKIKQSILNAYLKENIQ